MTQPIHYGMTQEEARARYQSTGNFEGPLPICGNGSFHVQTTRDRSQVTCAACRKLTPGGATRPVSAVLRFVSPRCGRRWFPQVMSLQGKEGTTHPCFVDLPDAYIQKRCPDGFAQASYAENEARLYLGQEEA